MLKNLVVSSKTVITSDPAPNRYCYIYCNIIINLHQIDSSLCHIHFHSSIPLLTDVTASRNVDVLSLLSDTVTGLLISPTIFSHTTVCRAKVQISAFLGTSVQVILFCVVVVGQVPQFKDRMLYFTAGQSEATILQLNVICCFE